MSRLFRIAGNHSSFEVLCCFFAVPQPEVASLQAPVQRRFRVPTAPERALVVQYMYSHSLSCASGDNTLPATLAAVKEVVSPRGLAQGSFA